MRMVEGRYADLAKMGRPKIDNPRTERVSLRLTPEQKAELYAYAKEHKQTITDILMKPFWEKIGKEKFCLVLVVASNAQW